jgi:hypothetical protein
MRLLGRATLAVLLGAVALGLIARAAGAHAILQTTSPPRGETLKAEP